MGSSFQCIILNIGDELLLGETLNTHAHHLSKACTDLGIMLRAHISVGDDIGAIHRALEGAEKEASLLILTGGVGPTSDDKTWEALSVHLRVPLEENEKAKDMVLAREKGVEKKLWHLPQKSEALYNEVGVAPGIWLTTPKHVYVVLPGVPQEMHTIFFTEVIPRLQAFVKHKNIPLPILLHRYFHTAGIEESLLYAKLPPNLQRLNKEPSGQDPFLRLAFLPKPGQVSLRLTALSSSLSLAKKSLQKTQKDICAVLHKDIFSQEENGHITHAIAHKLRQKRCTLSIAESCTGGYLSHLITQYPGASTFFAGGVIAYQNAVKEQLLGVKAEDLSRYGAVSKPVAEAMAQGVAQALGTDIGLATTGMFPPPQEKKGEVWLACAYKKTLSTRHIRPHTTRAIGIETAAYYGLKLLYDMLE